MGIKISKDHLHPSVIESITSLIGDLNQLETTAKGNAVEAINELLANGGNKEELEALIAEIAEGKELIANAVGEPLTAEESFDEMSNGINSLLSQFKTNMMKNGVTIESGDKFKSLIDKIATMVEEGEGKGIQFAEGECDVSVYDNASNVSSNYVYDPTNGIISYGTTLDFTPTAIFLCVPKLFWGFNDSQMVCNAVISSLYNNSSSKVATLGAYNRSSNGASAEGIVEAYITNVTNSTFKLYVLPHSGSYRGIKCKCQWYAIGVGEEDTTLRDSLASILENKGVDVTEEDDMASLIAKVDEEFDNRITMKTGTLNYTNGLVGENNNGKLIITHNLGTIPSYIVCRTSEMDYMPNDSSVGRNFTGSLCLTIDNSAYVTANGNRATLSITDITENTFTVLTTMETSGRLSGWIEEWIVMK